MRLESLPSLKRAKIRYNLKFNNYSIFIYHPVTTEGQKKIKSDLSCLLKVVKKSNENFILIYPNNDPGSSVIIDYYEKKFKKLNNTKIFRSIRFEYFLSLLKNSYCIIGNSSSGVREAPFYGVPTIDLGNRQKDRTKYKSIYSIGFDSKKILKIFKSLKRKNFSKVKLYGQGNSSKKIVNILSKKHVWKTSKQKYLQEI